MKLLDELRRRNVIRVAGLYLVGAWLVVQVASTVFPAFELPPWALRAVILLVAIGLLPALAFAWAFELTPGGLKRDADADPTASGVSRTAHRIDRLIIVVLALALGYFALDKFVLSPRREASRPPVAQAPTRGTAPAATRPADATIAVLPFVSMSAEADNEFFSDGLSEEILNSLARIQRMQVVGRTSSFQFKGRNEDLREIGRKLGVANVLEGSVRREGQRARITAQLIRASDGTHLWSQTYDRTLEDTLAVQLDIAENVAGALGVLLDDRQRATMRKAGIHDVEAFIHYQKGWALYLDAHRNPAIDTIDGLRAANVEFDRAIALEPDYSIAHYAKADLYEHTLIDDSTTQAERLDAQRAVLQTLEQAAATSPDAQQRDFALAERQMLDDDWRGIAERLAVALRQPGCSPPNWMPVFASAFGYADALEPVLARAAVCDPLNTINWNTRTWVARAEGNGARMEAIYAQQRSYQPDLARGPQERLAAAILGKPDDSAVTTPGTPTSAANHAIAMQIARLRGMDHARARAWVGPGDRKTIKLREWDIVDLVDAALFGERAEANRRAARLDARPAGGLLLAVAVTYCGCGAPFDLAATPRFKARLDESGLRWPPPVAIRYPPLAPSP